MTTEHALLKLAHRTPMVPEDARALVDLLSGHFGIAAPQVRFRVRSYGKAGPLGRYIVLPRERMRPASGAIGYLRVGIVVHEFAHILARLLHGRVEHGLQFVQVLDAVLRVSQPLWEETR